MLEAGMVFAIEPFASTGSGRVGEKTRREIYQQISNKPVRIPSGRAIMERIRDRRGLPFARRWIPDKKCDIALPALVRNHNLHVYPVLADQPVPCALRLRYAGPVSRLVFPVSAGSFFGSLVTPLLRPSCARLANAVSSAFVRTMAIRPPPPPPKLLAPGPPLAVIVFVPARLPATMPAPTWR